MENITEKVNAGSIFKRTVANVLICARICFTWSCDQRQVYDEFQYGTHTVETKCPKAKKSETDFTGQHFCCSDFDPYYGRSRNLVNKTVIL